MRRKTETKRKGHDMKTYFELNVIKKSTIYIHYQAKTKVMCVKEIH